MKIEQVDLFHIRVPMIEPFRISSGVVAEKDALILKLYAEGLVGYGEASPMAGSFYSADTPESCWKELSQTLIPAFVGRELENPQTAWAVLSTLPGSSFAKAGLETAVWHLHAQKVGQPLHRLLGGERTRVRCGLAVGIYDTVDQLIAAIERHLHQRRYRRLKIKIQPGWDVRPVEAVRRRFEGIPLLVDANGAYTLDYLDILKELDTYDLLMLEQPFRPHELEETAKLQGALTTPVCLDESIETVADVDRAARLGSCRIVNIKIQRVGGLERALAVNRACEEVGLPVWCGTMPELGLGQVFGLALSTLANFDYPTDVEPSDRFFVDDIVEPLLEIDDDGCFVLKDEPLLGYEVNEEKIRRYTVRRESTGQVWS
jgi:O-succinylbenzoate synthase